MLTASREVEVKYQVADPAPLIAALAEHGFHLSDVATQDDQAYAQPGWEYGMSKIGVAFARLRTQGDLHVFTVKKPVDNDLSCLEYETQVADRDAMHQAVLCMGFVPTVRIVKQRRTARRGQVVVCLDDVLHAGIFVEFERIVGPEESAVDIQAELDSFARSLVSGLERTTQTYDSLVRDRQYPRP
ncbi:class IV adenylate cyclase [Frankia gtarii]|uniref:class IV adenylate cyclase n=1 Tax=Frankia gtarii TaxID=2950102 RepID=UPI0021BFC886|nr:class IV adenylate cyclase [Frankia gtarii]